MYEGLGDGSRPAALICLVSWFPEEAGIRLAICRVIVIETTIQLWSYGRSCAYHFQLAVICVYRVALFLKYLSTRW